MDPTDKGAARDTEARFPAEPDPYQLFLQWLSERRQDLIGEWVDRLASATPAYRQRTTAELFHTVTEAFDSNYEALAFERYERIDAFIDFITTKRLRAGFPLSNVQHAFELFREIVIQRLNTKDNLPMLGAALERINYCLSFTIPRFSDHFQHMHERTIQSYANNLERQVRLRTAELAESERRYKTLVNEINDGYFVIESERIVFANQAFCRMHGASLEEIIGQPFMDYVTEDCRERVLRSYRNAFKLRSDMGQIEYTRTGCPPEMAATEIRSKVVDMGHGPVTIGICRDISRRVAMEAKIREHERLAYVGHLAASLSHEIRNPLSTCTLNMQILEQKLKLSGFDKRRLEITVRELTRLEDILRQLLDLASPLSLQTTAVSMAEVARNCIDLLDAKTREKGLRLLQRHRPDTPMVQGDQAKLEQALLNLLLNAIEAVDVGGRIAVWSRLVQGQDPNMVELGVHDNGPGIDLEQRANLFTPFFTSKTRGTGLGLNNVKRITEAHQGQVLVKSRPGLGATFIMRLPWLP